MRITNTLMQDRLLRNLQSQGSQLLRASDQVSTGLRNSKLSDDPVAGAQILATDTALRAVEQYRVQLRDRSLQCRHAVTELA